MSSVQRSVARSSKLLARNLHPFSSMSAQAVNGHINGHVNGYNNTDSSIMSWTNKQRWQDRVRAMEHLSLRRIDALSAKELFEKEKYRLPKDIDFVSNGEKKDQIVLKINKLNQESSITLQLTDFYNETRIVEINRRFAIAHEPIAMAVQGTLNKYVETLQHRINKEC